MVVDTPISVVRAKLLEGFSSNKWGTWIDDPFVVENGFRMPPNSSGVSEGVPVYLEGSERSSFGWKFFKNVENRDKLFGAVHRPFLSHEYLVDGKPAVCTASFVVSLTPVTENETKIDVEMIDTAIYSGKMFSGHVLGFVPKPVSVPGAATDKFTFLKLILYVLKESPHAE